MRLPSNEEGVILHPGLGFGPTYASVTIMEMM